MARFGRKAAHSHDDGASDSVSELSHDDSSIHSNMSKSSAFRSKFLRGGKFGRKNKASASVDGTVSVGSASRSRANGGRSKGKAKGKTPSGARSVDVGGGRSVSSAKSAGARSAGGRSKGGGSAAGSKAGSKASGVDEKRLIKDAKSRFNIGLVYLKTGDYAKAQDNLEHSLYCHIQLKGHDSKLYTNETLFAVAGVREKLGECYHANTAIEDKCLAVDHYEESRRLLNSVDPEDAPDNLKEMLERVEEKLKLPELCSSSGGRRRPPPASRKYQQEGNKKAKAIMGVGAGAGAAAAARGSGGGSRGGEARAGGRKKKHKDTLEKIDILGIGKGIKEGVNFLHEIGEDLKDKIDDVLDTSSDGTGSRRSSLSDKDVDGFEMAMSHLERDNHRTALNYLSSLQEEAAMRSEDFRAEMAFCMLKVADGALESEKISVATDAYEEAYSVLKQDQVTGENLGNAMRGCIKCHKLLAIETEGMRDYSSAINHRSRVYQLLDENKKCVPACNQLLKIAYLHGIKDDYAKGIVSLSDAIRGLYKGVASIGVMPADRMKLLIQCYHMRAIFYSKSKKWNDAIEQYDELLPLISKTEGQGDKEYNCALIHKSALLVTMGNHRLAHTNVQKYIQLAELSNEISSGKMIVSDMDHAMALDTCAACNLQMGNIDKAVAIFEQKLKFVKTLYPSNDEMKCSTLHKLGCLMAYKNQQTTALPLLNEALTTRKVLYDGKHRSVFESTWAVAATNHTLGDNEKALKDYSVLLEKMTKGQDFPVDSVLIYNSAGKLFFDDGKLDKAAHAYQMALKGLESSHSPANPQLKAEVTLNLANVMSARGEADEAMVLYDQLLGTKSLKRTTTFFLTLYNKSLLLINIGEIDEAKEILTNVSATRTSLAADVKGNVYLTEGNLLITEGKVDEAMDSFEKVFEVVEEDDFNAIVQTKKSMANAYLQSNKIDRAIETLEDVLEYLSSSDVEGKSVELLKAEIWNSLSRVYKKKGDLPQAKNYAKLALQTYKSELGENNPITLRNISNLQLLLLEEAEDLPKGDAKSIIDAAKYEMEGALDAFVSLNDTWAYRLDVASLKTNLGFVAIWQGKPKKAKKLLRQIQEIEIPPESSLVQRVEVLEKRVDQLDKKKGK